MTCYEYEIIHTSENPILKNVDVSIVLAMKGTNRFIRDPFILNLAKTTIIQWNVGFKKCKKHSSIKKSHSDLNHAYETAFNYLKKYNNVIVFEDDAIVINEDLCIYKKIDEFIGDENFGRNGSIFSFGSISLLSTYNNDFLKVNGKVGGVQAVIYSHNSIINLLTQINNKGYNSGHIDSNFISNINNIFAYKYPLIVQLVPETENSNNWFSEYHPIITNLLLFTFKTLFKILNLQNKPDGWNTVYFFLKDIGRITWYLIILLILLLFYNKTNIIRL